MCFSKIVKGTMKWLVLLVATCSLHLVSPAEYLLPGGVVPTHYDVRLAFDVDPNTNFSFFGVVNILIHVTKQSSKIVLHSRDYVIPKQQIRISGSRPIHVISMTHNDTYDLMTLHLDGVVMPGDNYTLTIPFFGNLKPGLDGAYISSYVNKKTKEQEYLVTTQFEPISARKGFPCFDEPMYKATFSIIIGHHKDYTAISNMPLERSTTESFMEDFWPWSRIESAFKKPRTDFVWDKFQRSVPMSTYLVAYIVSRFSSVQSPPQLSRTSFRIWARSDAIAQTAYASLTGPKALSFYEQWFNVSYPLPKQDMVAIPDFSAGAMENWGLITYRETDLLFDENQSSFLNKERVAEVISHELAHQWFGNLVTMKWWSDLWLNEGFATYAAAVAVNKVEPTWRAADAYAVEHMMSVLELDALQSSHPVSVPIDDPKRISEIFDDISYRKGSTLIRMMTMFLGDEVFRKAINNYLITHSYHNAEQDDLWRELNTVSQQYGALTRNVTVKQVMDSWTKQTGYPVLTVIRDYGDQRMLSINQKRFLSLRRPDTNANGSWWVPLAVMCEGEAAPPPALQWLGDREGVEGERQPYEHAAQPQQWVLFNYNMIAPYRVNYDLRNWDLLTAALKSPRRDSVPVLGRVQLLSDAFALAWTNQLNYSTAIALASYLQYETEYLPLSIGLRGLAKIENVIKRSPEYGIYQKFVRKIVTDTYMRVGGLAKKTIVNAHDLNSVKMQVLTSSWACRMRVPGCEDNAIEMYKQWMNTENPDENNPIPLDLRRTVCCVGVSRGAVAEWRFALARLRRANVASAQDALRHALTCAREPWILAQYLEWTITEGSEVRKQDAAGIIAGIMRSPGGFYVAKEFMYDRIQDISNAFKGQPRRVGMLTKVLLDQFTKQRELDEFLVWRDKNLKYFVESKLSVEQAIENARVNIAWLENNRQAVVSTLREYSTDGEQKVKHKMVGSLSGAPLHTVGVKLFVFAYILHVL